MEDKILGEILYQSLKMFDTNETKSDIFLYVVQLSNKLLLRKKNLKGILLIIFFQPWLEKVSAFLRR